MNDEMSLIEQANAAANRLEHAIVANKDLLQRLEAIEARKALGGRSDAGVPSPQMTEAEKNRIDTQNLFKGTPIERALK